MQVPEGFHVTLFAGEPDVRQPIAFCIDDRGRLWVAEAYNYPNHGTVPGDRILIFDDTDGDGRFDTRTVFYDKLNYVTGIEVGFGGAWVMSPPFFYFIPDRDRDDRPDGDPEVLLDGFGNHANAHNLANGFAWGPDGWLYGTHGRTNWSLPGKPGTPGDHRIRFDGGVYRYHPLRHVWEPFADGSTNPWGIDWDDFGEGFVCNCVDPHLFHVIQGAHYEPWRNRQSSEFAYERIPSIADHLHFVGRKTVQQGLGTPEEDAAGGGHAHCGTMIYLGDNWPLRYRNTFFTNNIHGKRINNDILHRQGSGYTASHGRDLLRSQDPWYMGVTLQYGPDGSVFASDWSDTGECHSVKNTRRQTGRIYKISFGRPRIGRIDLAERTDHELVGMQLHRNDWHVRHARRLLQERAAAGRDLTEVRHDLLAIFRDQTDVPRRLRALWALKAIGGLDNEFLVRELDDPSEYVRSWCIRLLCEDGNPPDEALRRFRDLAAVGDSPFDRLHLASALQRLSPARRWSIAEALLTRAEDATDANLPLMIWYGIEPLLHDDADRFVALAGAAKFPLVRRHIARRAASNAKKGADLVSLVRLAGNSAVDLREDLLEGMLKGLEGHRTFEMPAGWPEAYTRIQQGSQEAVNEQALELALIFDDPVAIQVLRNRAGDTKADAKARNRAIQALTAKQARGFTTMLLELVADPVTRSAALRGLAEYDDARTPATILDDYGAFDVIARQDAVQTLAARPSWASALLDAVESNRIPRSDITAFTARQLLNLGNNRLTDRVNALWGTVRETAADKAQLITDYKKRLTSKVLADADRSAGRVVYQQLCANCHKLFDAGGKIGPDITGAQRQNLDYLLENMVDPSGAVVRDYQLQIFETTSGRIITGLVVAESKAAVAIQTVNEKIVVPTVDIESRVTSSVSMMPDGMLQKLSLVQIRDLIGYVSGATQVPLKE